MPEQVGDGGAHAVVERGGGQGARFHGTGADGRGEAQAEHLVAVAAGAALVPDGLGGGEGERDALGGGVGSVGAGQDVSEEVVDGPYGRLVEGGGAHASTAAVRSWHA